MNTAQDLEGISRVYAEQLPGWRHYLAGIAAEVARVVDAKQLHATVKWRVKTFESLSEKRSFLARKHKGAEAEIKDLLGLRIVVPFQEDVERSVILLRSHYNIGEIERKSEKLSFREFAYDSVHVELPVPERMVLPPGCRAGLEVQ